MSFCTTRLNPVNFGSPLVVVIMVKWCQKRLEKIDAYLSYRNKNVFTTRILNYLQYKTDCRAGKNIILLNCSTIVNSGAHTYLVGRQKTMCIPSTITRIGFLIYFSFVLTWHSYMPASECWTSFIIKFHSPFSGTCAIWMRASCTYVISAIVNGLGLLAFLHTTCKISDFLVWNG